MSNWVSNNGRVNCFICQHCCSPSCPCCCSPCRCCSPSCPCCCPPSCSCCCSPSCCCPPSCSCCCPPCCSWPWCCSWTWSCPPWLKDQLISERFYLFLVIFILMRIED